jgi:methyltransferase (TIGR00027 family)
MKQKQSSRSAAGVAGMRAVESLRPERTRIVFDPYARAFASGFLSTFLRLMIDSGIYARIGGKGAMEFIVLRERYIDDYLKACLREGLDQVVILGAGFDTRAYRIPGIEKTHVFEVDHPNTQEVKLGKLRKVIDPLPSHVTFVPMDFNTQSLCKHLQASGYNEQGKTLFIWQGVTYFLTAQGVDNTLAFIAEHSGPGSAVVFDYFYSETLHDKSRRDVQMMQRTARLVGEEYMFGIDKGRVEEFLTERGFHDIHNMTIEDLGKLYFTGPNSKRPVRPGLAIVSAKVNRTAD